ncbi:MAG: hypothetical protein WCC87_08440 [Candidatus Korobacteraceae bacterium]
MKLPEVSCMNEEERNNLIRKMKISSPKAARQCEHIKINGEFCGSPALRGRNYCYFHLTYIGRRVRAERVHAAALAEPTETPVATLELPPLEDANSIQMALMQVIDAILHNRLDNKRAGLVLYALQTASSNLANGADFSQMNGATVAGGYEAFEQDFELDDDMPELKVNETEQNVEQVAKITQIEEQAAAYAKLDAAEAEADAKRTETENEEDDGQTRGSYPCGLVSQFFCSLDGPLSRRQSGAAEPVRRIEREAASQWLEIAPILSPDADEEEEEVVEEGTAA